MIMFGECHAHIFMDGKNYKKAVERHKNGVDESVIRSHFACYQTQGIHFVRDGGDALGVSRRAKELAPEYGIDYRTPIFAIHKNGHYGKIVGKGFDTLKEKVVNPLKGKKIGAYYGCLLLRPGKIMAFDNPENPSVIEDFIRAIGAEPVIYPYRNECCGGYISLKEKEMAENMSKKVTDSAKGFGAEMLITACPLCLYNLKKNGNQTLPVYYFTELLAEALGVKEEAKREVAGNE